MNTSSKREVLLLFVQTWIQTNSPPIVGNSSGMAQFAISCLADVITLDEDLIPGDIEKACKEMMEYRYRLLDGSLYGSRIPQPPEWFKPKMRMGVGVKDSRIYPWTE